MWIDRAEWNRLKARVDALERDVTMSVVTYHTGNGCTFYSGNMKVGVKEVVERLLSKLHLNLHSTPASIEIIDRADQ